MRKLTGDSPLRGRLKNRNRKTGGYKTNVTRAATGTPIIAIEAIDFRAGCCAKINDPMANKVVVTAKRIEIL